MRHLFMLDEGMVYLNHGAFGATMKELFACQRRWQERMEAQPARFFMSELPDLIRQAAGLLASAVGTDASRLVFTENATSGVNGILRSLRLVAGDRIVTTNHVYNAVRNIIHHVCDFHGADYCEMPIPLPLGEGDDIAGLILDTCDERTRLVVVDHIASPSGLVLPVAEIVRRCRERGIAVLVDGSHAPGQVDLDIDAIGADWYVGNCHKWLCAPKGAGFIVVGEGNETPIHPSIISHAYGQGLLAEYGKVGTRDPSAWLTVPAALEMQERLGGRQLRERNHRLAVAGAQRVADALGTELCAAPHHFAATATVRIPGIFEPNWETALEFRRLLWVQSRVDAIVAPLAGALWVRLCAFIYNDEDDFAVVPEAVAAASQKFAGFQIAGRA